MSALQPIYNLPIRYKQGGVISWASNTTLSITSLLARSHADDLDINVGDFFGETTGPSSTIVNGASNGLNGLDTGTLAASTVYAVYAIADQAGYNPSGFILSLNTSYPQMPTGNFASGYNSYVRIGWAITNSSTHFENIVAYGNGTSVWYEYTIPVEILTSGNATSQTTINIGAVVPSVSYIPITVGTYFVGSAASQSGTIAITGAQTTANSTNQVVCQVASVGVRGQFNTAAGLSNGVASLDYDVSNSAAALSLWINGFTDYLT